MRHFFVFALVASLCSCRPADANSQAAPAETPARHAAHQSAAPTDGADFSMYKALYDRHSAYKEPSITRQRFKHAAIAPLVQRLQSPFQWSVDGKSIEGRNIYRVQYGNGPIKVLLWSQMHGDEPTATMALMDIFNFLSRSDEWDELRSRLRSELTLVFVPMLNPDGAERFERRNALGIDLNRDALRLQCPESQLLKRLRDELSAQWGFNLHDQGRFYGAGLGPKNAAMAFLAPAYNYEKEINDSRGNAMQLIAGLSAFLHEYIPGHIARYDDEFEPRAFGDNIQKWGTSTILIEAGVLPNDPEKQELRRLHFAALLMALDAIASQKVEQFDIAGYEQIPFNKSNFFHDLIIREAEVEKAGRVYTLDIGFRRDGSSVSISDQGDLSIFHAFDEVDARGMRLTPGKTYSKVIPDMAAAQNLDLLQLLRQGYTELQMTKRPDSQPTGFPFLIVAPGKSGSRELKPGRNPSFVLMQNGRVRWAVVNGRAFDLERDAPLIRNVVGQK
ncbi:MAG TPA: M14 family zinc carboxypeptidase [Saprospiraceae bacterium]|nr:M14 family zinc carboxypeptidase [Saprospiraceae bacterium]